MSLLGAESYSTGSSNSAQQATSQSQSDTFGAEARAWSAQQAQIAREWQEKMFEKEMAYNSAEAEKSRAWQQANIDTANNMANTVYTRSVDNMRAAGINPILAASHGLGAAGSGTVTSGAGASVSAPNGFMGQSFADQHSASSSQSSGESHGSNWSESTSGLATALEQMAGLISGVMNGLNAASQIDVNINGLGDLIGDARKTSSKGARKGTFEYSIDGLKDVKDGKKSLGNWLIDEATSLINPLNSPFFEQIKKNRENAKKGLTPVK